MANILYCPSCGKPMSVPPGPVSESLECPHCRHIFGANIPVARPVGPPRPPIPGAPWGEVSPKSRLLAGLLGVFLGGLGLHRFYLGFWGIGFLQILVTTVSVILCLRIHGYTVGFIWGFIEGILILGGKMRDAQGRRVLHF